MNNEEEYGELCNNCDKCCYCGNCECYKCHQKESGNGSLIKFDSLNYF